jgi:hypothetical protein
MDEADRYLSYRQDHTAKGYQLSLFYLIIRGTGNNRSYLMTLLNRHRLSLQVVIAGRTTLARHSLLSRFLEEVEQTMTLERLRPERSLMALTM